MRKRIKIVLLVLISLLVIRVIFVLPDLLTFFPLQAASKQTAGTWEDDPKNWFRAFNEQTPPDVQVLHSKYWKSDHFTYEYIYFFEISATPGWKETFLKNRNLELVSPSKARDYRPTQPISFRTGSCQDHSKIMRLMAPSG
jgi:hypothetical protein